MWRCLVFVVAVTLWNLPVLAAPQGDNTCQGVVKHPVKVKVNVTEPVTFRTYTWCLRVPPRCSKYIVQMRERVKEQIELHNRTITVCCRGYVEMESKCVPACPPMTECPNMHCNRTNHCYCSPGYSGVFCNDPCPKGTWGRDCKKPCDCPDGFTCHHLTGDCMLDDKPSIKTTVRHSRFTHISSETVTTQSPLITSHPPSHTSALTTKTTITVSTTPSSLSILSSNSTYLNTHDFFTLPTTSASVKHNQNYNPAEETVVSPIVGTGHSTTPNSLGKPSKSSSVHSAHAFDREYIASTLKTTPEYVTNSPSSSLKSSNNFTNLFVPNKELVTTNKISYNISNVRPIITSTTSSRYAAVPNPRESHGTTLSFKPSKNLKTIDKSVIVPTASISNTPSSSLSSENQDISIPTSTEYSQKISTFSAFGIWNDSKQENIHEKQTPHESISSEQLDYIASSTKMPTQQTPIQINASPKLVNNEMTDYFFTIAKTVSTSSPVSLGAEPTQISSNIKKYPEILTTELPSFHFDDSITKPGNIPLNPMRTPYKILNPFIPAPPPTQSHGSLTLPVTELSFIEKENATGNIIKMARAHGTNFTAKIEPVVTSTGLHDMHVDTTTISQEFKLLNKNDIDIYQNPSRKEDVTSNSQNEFFTSSESYPLRPQFNSKTKITYDMDKVDTEKGIFVFPPRMPVRTPSYARTAEPNEEESTLPTTSLSESSTDMGNIPLYSEKVHYLPPELTSPSIAPVPLTTASSVLLTPKVDKDENIHNGSKLHKLSYVTAPPYFSSSEFLPPFKNIFTKRIELEKSLKSPPVVPLENRKHTASPFDILRTMMNSSKAGERGKDSYKQKQGVFGNFNPNAAPELSTKQTVEHSMVGSVLNELSKNDFIAIFRPEPDMKSNIMPFTSPDREYIKPVIKSNINLFTFSESEQTKPTMKSNINTFTLPATHQTRSADIDDLGTNSIIASTYSKTFTSPVGVTYSTKNTLNDRVTEKVETISGDTHFSRNYSSLNDSSLDALKADTMSKTTPIESLTDKNHTVNGKLLEEPSNFLPTVHDKTTTVSKANSDEQFQPSSILFVATEAPQPNYNPTDKDILNLTYILNSINDFTVNSKRGMKQSPKSFMYGNSVKIKTEKPFSSDLITNTVQDIEPSDEMEKTISTVPAQKHFKQNYNQGSLNKRGRNGINDSKIIHLNISSHLSFHNPSTTRITQKFPVSAKDTSLPTFHHSKPPSMYTRFVDGRVTTVSIISTVPVSKSPTKRSTKENNSIKTENAFNLNDRTNLQENRPVLETSTAAYSPLKVTQISFGIYSTNSLQKSVSENEEVSKKPFRRKETLEETESEMRPDMTAALSAHSAHVEDDSTISFTTGILATLTCILLVGSLSSMLILIYIYCRKEKPVPMEPSIMAYETSNTIDPSPIYSVPRPSLLPEIFFCPTFTHNYAAQINKELRELSYNSSQKENNEPVYTEISN